MKKKTFYQNNIFWQLICCVPLVISIISFILDVELIIHFINNGLGVDNNDKIISIFNLVILLVGTFMFLMFFIQLEHNNIHLTNDKIYMNDDWNKKTDKIQYYSEVNFIDIEAVDIIWTKKDSKGKIIRSKLMSAYVVKPYLSIKTKDGKVVNFFILYIVKKDVIKIINEIRRRMKNVGNNTEIIDDDEAYSKINKKLYMEI